MIIAKPREAEQLIDELRHLSLTESEIWTVRKWVNIEAWRLEARQVLSWMDMIDGMSPTGGARTA